MTAPPHRVALEDYVPLQESGNGASTAELYIGGTKDYSKFETIDEAWELNWPEGPHPYLASAFFAIRGLGDGAWHHCLTVGSTAFEARMLRGWRWVVTMLDVREPPVTDLPYLVGDATDIPLPSHYFDAVSSTCCLCHVGLGRYGDKVVERGDLVALKEFARVLNKGGKASVMFGPCIPNLKRTLTLGTVHRIYAIADVEAMAEEAGFKIDTAGLWCADKKGWLTPDEVEERKRQTVKPDEVIHYRYLSMLLEKK